MDEELRALTERLRAESAASGAPGARETYDRLLATGDPDELAAVLTEPGQPLWAREMAAFRLGVAGDRRAFESLVLLLNHRDPRAVPPPPTPSPGSATRAPPAPPRPSPPTNSGSPTPSTRYGCWSSCGPRRPRPP